MTRERSYQPFEWLARDPELKGVVDAIWRGNFNQGEQGLFDDIGRIFTEWGDSYYHCADFRSYADAQQRVSDLFRDRHAWARKALLNVARIGYFSSDRAIREYAEEIWHLQPVPVAMKSLPDSSKK
jgi:starch phosphorylase